MIPLQYEGDVYRPPSEAGSLILQATIGCSHNRCTFCGMYKKKKFRIRGLEELEREIEQVSRFLPGTRRIFLADGNALVVPTEQLLQILQSLQEAFPKLERVSVYGNPQDLLDKSADELVELKNNKLGIVYLGLETGSLSVLEDIKKEVTPGEIVKGSTRAKEAGVPLSITVLNGLAGLEGTEEHARETARVLNQIDPQYLGLLSLIPVPGTTTHRHFEKGKLTALTPWQLLEEIRMMVEGWELTHCVFRANHASNYLPMKAVLSRDRDNLLAEIDRVLARKAPGSLKSEFLRGL